MIWPERCVEDGADLAVVDGRNEGSEGGAEAQGDGVSEGDAEIADGEAEGDAADAPEHSQEDGVVDGCGVGAVGLCEDAEQTWGTKMLASTTGAMIQAAKPWMIQ